MACILLFCGCQFLSLNLEEEKGAMTKEIKLIETLNKNNKITYVYP